ncbi:GroES-like protein [Penicillium mononematosum]|uniref:GroES-like protein n=1 Tax=Penicillium mononematosum TaxID=268346 RepID=UPI0025484250|nr:GroES-like protein [Penicillium mononematosum]KAJ6178237.1 GroES-like protein [Penicillium mononematosum]
MTRTAATQHAWAVVEHGKPLQKIEIPIPEPVGTEVLIKVSHCGVCHSDLHFWEGSYDLGGGKRLYVKDRGAKLPRALGHEILGAVAKLGPDADPASIPIGASRAVYPWVGCQDCRHCESEDDNLCLGQKIRGIFSNGGFAQYITVPHPRYLVDYGSVDPSIACTFGCSGLTVLSSIQKLMPLRPQDPVLLIGAGGLGLSGISMLKALGHERIITTDIAADKLAAALSAGATAVVNSKSQDPVEEIIKNAGGPISGVIDFVGNKQTAELAMASIVKGGKVVVVGIMGGEMNLSLVPFTFGAKSILGNITGTPKHMREVAKIANSGKLAPIPITKVPWELANDAIQRLHEGRVTGRLVLVH